MTISGKDRKLLWTRAHDRCSFPDCETNLSIKANDGTDLILGEEAHINGEKRGAARYIPLLSTKRDAYDNRILLCPTHHTLIDKAPETYSAETLRAIKMDHEAEMLARSLANERGVEAGIAALGRRLPATRFTFGRSEEISLLVSRILADPPVASFVLGPPGVGKTHLTLAALHHPSVAERFGNRRFFIRCEAAMSARSVVGELAATLPSIDVGDSLVGALDLLGEGPAAIAFDNAETPWDADPLATEELLRLVADVRYVAVVASIRGSVIPSGAKWAPPIRVAPLGLSDARDLFLAAAGEEFDQPGLTALLNEMGGIALAIEVLAHAAEGEPDVSGLARLWRAEGANLLTRGQGGDSRLSVAWSVEASWTGQLMTDHARRLLSLLGRLPDGIANDDIHEIMPAGGLLAANCLRSRCLSFNERGRLRTYPPIRNYIEKAHPPSAEDWARAVLHYGHRAKELAPQVGRKRGVEFVARLHLDIANIQATLNSPLSDQIDFALDAIHAVANLVRWNGFDTKALFESAAHLARDTAQSARAYCDLAELARTRSDHEGAEAGFSRALSLYKRENDELGIAQCLKGLGDIAMRRSDLTCAAEQYTEALALFRRSSDPVGEGYALFSLGDVARLRSDREATLSYLGEALSLFRTTGTIHGEASCLKAMGESALACSDYDLASQHFIAARSLFEGMGSVGGGAGCTLSLAHLARIRSDWEEARLGFETAIPLFRRVGALAGEANCIKGLAEIALERSDYDVAMAYFLQALPLFSGAEDLAGEAYCRKGLGDISLSRSNFLDARVHYEKALSLFRDASAIVGEANCIHALAGLDVELGQYAGARAEFERARVLFQQAGDSAGERYCLSRLEQLPPT